MLEKIPDNMLYELSEPEIEMLRQADELIRTNEIIPSAAFLMLSKIAFGMAMQSLEAGKNFEAAKILGKETGNLFRSDRVSLYDKDRLRREISETLLDFSYAGGRRGVASLRMAPYIRAKKNI